MSLNAWDWEEDTEGIDVMSSLMNFYPSEFDMDEYVKVKTFSQESDSERPCSSEMSTHAPSSFFQSDVPHVVPCRFIISLAFPAFGHKGKQYNVVDKNRRFPRIEKPTSKMRRFYHLEYYLLPDDIEPKMVDILLFPLVAKVFLDSGMKTVKLWGEGEKIWVSWPQTFNINMTKELLKKINFHSITLRLWDTKDKVSKKVRYYRMKPSGLSEDLGSFEEVKNLVLNQRRLSERHNHIKEELMSVMPLRKTEKSKKHKAGHEKETSPKSAGEHDKQTKMEDFSNSQWGVSGRLSIVGGVAGLAMKEIIERSSFGSLTNTYEKQKFPMRIRESGEKKKGQKKKKKLPTDEDVEPKSGSHWKPEVFSAHLPMTPLLAGTQNIVSHSSWKSATVLGCYLTLSTKVPIMTEDQRLELNPLTIKINCATCLPSQPVSIQELEKLCMPVYCKYQFHNTPVHKTQGKPHGTHVCFQDTNVIFLGVMHPSDLKEYLEGPPMLVEVHDRDRKTEEGNQKPTLFGEDSLDAYLNSHALISSKDTETNPFEFQKKVWDPYGVAHVSFADLLLGHKHLNLDAPILSCDPRPVNHNLDLRDRKVRGILLPKENVQPVPMGNYLEASSMLKLRVEVAVPLQLHRDLSETEQAGVSVFGRVIFVFESRKLLLLQKLLEDMTIINATALELDCYPLESIQEILSAFNMRVRIQDRPDLDVLTGFHLVDGRLHVLILEGLAEGALRRLWESHQNRPGDHPVPRAPFPAHGAAAQAPQDLHAQCRAQGGLPGPHQDLLHLPLLQPAEGGHHQRPAADLLHAQGPEPGVRPAHFARRPDGGEAAAGAQALRAPPAKLPQPVLQPLQGHPCP